MLWLVWSQRTYAGYPRNRAAVRLQYDIDRHQPRTIGLYGFQGTIHRIGDDRLPASADQAKQTKSLFDCGRSSGPSFQTGQRLGASAPKTNSVVLLAGVQPSVESGRTSQSGCQNQCRGATTAERPAGDDATGPVVPAKYATPTSDCQKLF